MKKTYFTTALLVALSLLFTACTASTPSSQGASPSSASASGDALNIVCTTYPVYDWTREVLGERFEEANVTLLYDNGVDMHSFQPSVDDMLTITESDLFLYVGGESEQWVEEVLAENGDNGTHVVKLMDVIEDRLLPDGLLDGMQAHDHDHDTSVADDHDHDTSTTDDAHDHEGLMDEHIWLSLTNAEILTQNIADTLGELDSANAQEYQDNAAAYIDSLHALDEEYITMVNEAELDTILFADRFPFRYLCNDYGIIPYAAFPGCSAETEASFETVASLSDSLSEHALPYILLADDGDDALAFTLMDNTGLECEILRLNSMQNVSDDFAESDANYLTIMQENLEVLRTALNVKE